MHKDQGVIQILILSVLAVAMIAVVGPAVRGVLAEQQQGKDIQGPPCKHPMHGPSGICADQQYLFVLSGGKIMQYGKSDLKLLKSVNLPKPSPPGTPSEDGNPCWFPPPPPMGQGPAFWPGDNILYVLAGPKVLVYSTSDMSLKTTVDLPAPAPR